MEPATKNPSSHFGVKKFYPSVDECRVNNLVKCSEEGCQNVFTSESNLNLHLAKTHKKSHLLESDSCSKQYYCPVLGCTYNRDKFFKTMKFLRQHYLKVHSAKEFSCQVCLKKFPTENILRNHTEYCGIIFNCCDCEAAYPCYDTLKTHGRRKKHKILVKPQYKVKVSGSVSEVNITNHSKNRLILPKCASLTLLNRTTSNQECQTVASLPKLKSKMTQVNRDASLALQTTQQTQTGCKNLLLTVETQTIGDFINVNQKKILDIITDTSNIKSSKTQTDVVESKSSSCNTSFNLEDFEFTLRADITKNSLGTQTSFGKTSDIYSTSTTTHDTIHTDTSDLLRDALNVNMSSFEFDNCHMETQTDFRLEDEMFSCDYYMSNMYTQTCDEILNDLGFNDIQTQTVFDDVLRSVESQTMMSHGKKVNIGCKDTTHMETQTDTEFRQILEVINS